MEASRGVKALLLPALDLAPASSSCFPGILAKRLTRGLCQVVQNSGVIAKNGGLNVIFLNGLANLLDMKFLKL